MFCILGGGEWQVPLIKYIKEKGYKVLCINLFRNKQSAQLADYYELCDIRDKDKCLEIASRYSKEHGLIGVLSDQSDIAIPTVAYLSEVLGLRGIGYETALSFSDKYRMREACKALGLANPNYFLVSQETNLKELLSDKDLPLVVKPRNSQSSRGVSVAYCLEDLTEKIDNALSFSYGHEDVLLEEYIEGVEYTVEGYSSNGKNSSIAYSVKTHYKSNSMVASSLCYPGDLCDIERQKLFKLSESIVDYLGLEFGITHAEFIKRGSEFYLVEVAARGGGTKISSDIVPTVSNSNFYELLLSEFVDDENKSAGQVYSEQTYVTLQFLDFQPGKVTERLSVDEVLSFDGVIDFNYSFELREELSSIEDDRSRHAHLILKAKSKHELVERVNGIYQIVKSAMKYD